MRNGISQNNEYFINICNFMGVLTNYFDIRIFSEKYKIQLEADGSLKRATWYRLKKFLVMYDTTSFKYSNLPLPTIPPFPQNIPE